MRVEFSPHALEKMLERSIAADEVQAVLDAPAAVRGSYRRRRVFVGIAGARSIEVVLSPAGEEPPTVITVYLTE